MAPEKPLVANPLYEKNLPNNIHTQLASAMAEKASNIFDYARFNRFTNEAQLARENFASLSIPGGFSWSDFKLSDLDATGGSAIIKSLDENGNGGIRNIIISSFKNKLKNSLNTISVGRGDALIIDLESDEDLTMKNFFKKLKEFLEAEKTAGNITEADITNILNNEIKWSEIQQKVFNVLPDETLQVAIQTGAWERLQRGEAVGKGYIGRLPSIEQKLSNIGNLLGIENIEKYLNDSQYNELKFALTSIPTHSLFDYLNSGKTIKVETDDGEVTFDKGTQHKKQILEAIRNNQFDEDKKFAFAQAFGLDNEAGYSFLFDGPNSQGDKLLDAIFDPDKKSVTIDFPGAGSIPLQFGEKNIFFRTKNGADKGENIENMALFFDYKIQPLDPQFDEVLNDIGVDKKINFGNQKLYSGYKISAIDENGKTISGYPRLDMDENGSEILMLYKQHPLNYPNPEIVGYTKNPESVNILQAQHSLGYEDMTKFLAILAGYKAFDYLSDEQKSKAMQDFRKHSQASSVGNLAGYGEYRNSLEQEKLNKEKEEQEKKLKVEEDKKISQDKKILEADPYWEERKKFGEMMKKDFKSLSLDNDNLPKPGQTFIIDAGIPSLIDSGNTKIFLDVSYIDKKTNMMHLKMRGAENRLGKFEGHNLSVFMSPNEWSNFKSEKSIDSINTLKENITTKASFHNYIEQSDVDGWLNKDTLKNLINKPNSGYLVKGDGGELSSNSEVIKYTLHGGNVELENMAGGGKHFLSYEGFLTFLSKPFNVYSEQEFKDSGYDPKKNIPGISKPFKFISVGAAIGAVKGVFKNWQDYNKKRDELGTAELEQSLYGMLSWLPGMSEIATNSGNSKISSMIDDFKKGFDTAAKLDPGPVYDEILNLITHPKSSHRYKLKAAGAMLYVLEKGGLYPKSLAKISGQGYFVNALLGPVHKQAFLDYSANLRAKISQGGDSFDSNRERLANAEIEYLNMVANSDGAPGKMFAKLFGTDFDEKLDNAKRKTQGAGGIEEAYKSLKDYSDPKDIFEDSQKAIKGQNVGKALGGLQALIEKQGSGMGRRYFFELATMIIFSGIGNRFSKAQWDNFDKIVVSGGYYFLAGSIKEPSKAIDSLEIIDALAKIGNIPTLGSALALNKNNFSDLDDRHYISGFDTRLKSIESRFDNNRNRYKEMINPENNATSHEIIKVSQSDSKTETRKGATMYLNSFSGDDTADPSKPYLSDVVKKNSLGLNSSVNHLFKTSNDGARTNFWTSRTKTLRGRSSDLETAKSTISRETNILRKISSSWDGGLGDQIRDYMNLQNSGKIGDKVFNAEQKEAKKIEISNNIATTLRSNMQKQYGSFYRGNDGPWYDNLPQEMQDWVSTFVRYLESSSKNLDEKQMKDLISVLKLKEGDKSGTKSVNEANRILHPERYKNMFNQGLDDYDMAA